MSIYLGNTLIAGSQPNAANKDLSNLSTVGQEILDNKLNKQMISNCITHIPQDIKLELNNGTLTLKAGSKVYVPNGAGVFDTFTVANDVSWVKSTTAGTRMAFCSIDGGLPGIVSNYCYSGDTAEMNSTTAYTYARFYNTETNKIYVGNSNGGSWVEVANSLPICIFTNDSSGNVTSIDQVFNGFGYIGSTVFTLPGVKSLFADGRNEDGTLKNVEKTTTQVGVRNESPYTSLLAIFDGTELFSYGVPYYLEQDTAPTGFGTHAIWLNTRENKTYVTNDGGSSWTAKYRMCLGELIKQPNENITKLSLKTTFHALDFNDKSTIVRWGMPDYSKTSSVTAGAYRATSDCVVYIVVTDKSGGISHTIYVDGVSIAAIHSDYAVHQCTPVYLKQGSQLTMSSYGNVNAYRVVPLIGSN